MFSPFGQFPVAFAKQITPKYWEKNAVKAFKVNLIRYAWGSHMKKLIKCRCGSQNEINIETPLEINSVDISLTCPSCKAQLFVSFEIKSAEAQAAASGLGDSPLPGVGGISSDPNSSNVPLSGLESVGDMFE